MTGKFPGMIRGALIIAAFMVVGGLLVGAATTPKDRTFHITSRRYAFDPPIIHVNVGDRVTVFLTSTDVTHGWYLDGYDLDAKISPDDKPLLRHPSLHDAFVQVPEIHFVANREGKFRYRCSQTCGCMHPFMIGEMVVAPNRLFGVGVGGAVGMTIAVLFAAMLKGGPKNG